MGSPAMTKLDDALRGISRLGLDTSPVIYFIEANPKYDAVVTEVFQRITGGAPEGFSSVISLAEVLVLPLRQGDQKLVKDFTDLLSHSRHFTLSSITPTIAVSAADLRARYTSLRTPDALQIAAALDSKCQAFLTNDVKLRQVKELPILILDDLEL
jgi:predicted nucleic acid-binding protein